jgi:hypothetical protein
MKKARAARADLARADAGVQAPDRREDAAVTAFQPPPERHWRSYGTDPLPTAQEALQQPLAAFPS